jgi:Mn-containing catalase
VTFKVKVKGHLKVKYRYYAQTSPNRKASCLNMVRDLENEPQGHLKVIGGYCAQTVGDRMGNISEYVCDLQGQGQRSSQGQISILYSNFTKSQGELFQSGP